MSEIVHILDLFLIISENLCDFTEEGGWVGEGVVNTSVQPYIFSQLTAAELACWRQIHSMHGIYQREE